MSQSGGFLFTFNNENFFIEHNELLDTGDIHQILEFVAEAISKINCKEAQDPREEIVSKSKRG